MTSQVVNTARRQGVPEGEELKNLLAMSRGLSFMLLAAYAMFLTFQLWSEYTPLYSFRLIPVHITNHCSPRIPVQTAKDQASPPTPGRTYACTRLCLPPTQLGPLPRQFVQRFDRVCQLERR